ncbi:MAG: discoidin domain-containing protein, partial [Planctomycetota bacterium]
MDRYAFRLCLLAALLVLSLFISPAPARTADVGDSMRELVEADWIRADVEFGSGGNGVLVPSTGSVTAPQDAAGGCDGVRNGRFGFHVASGERDPWWQVDLGRVVRLDRIVIHNRTDGGTATRTRNIQVLVGESSESLEFGLVYQHDG